MTVRRSVSDFFLTLGKSRKKSRRSCDLCLGNEKKSLGVKSEEKGGWQVTAICRQPEILAASSRQWAIQYEFRGSPKRVLVCQNSLKCSSCIRDCTSSVSLTILRTSCFCFTAWRVEGRLLRVFIQNFVMFELRKLHQASVSAMACHQKLV